MSIEERVMNRKMSFPARALVVAIAVLLVPSWRVHAGDTGKIAGNVRDRRTGEGLVGATVAVKGTNLGASTDVNGFYYILRVPPGVHEVQVRLVGYGTVTVKAVRVQIDLTSEVNVSLEQSTVEMKEVTVIAEQSLVQKD